MKNKLLIFVLLAFTFFTIIGCVNKENAGNKSDNNSEIIDSLDGVSMVIKEGTLTRTSATIVITDLSNKDNVYSPLYRIDRKETDEWVSLKTVDGKDWTEANWTMIRYVLDENNQLEMRCNWENLYGKLADGDYRIVKFVGKYPLSVEFTIE